MTNSEYIERGRIKLNQLLEKLAEKKEILQRIYKDGEDTLKQLEADIEEENERAKEEEVEFQNKLTIFQDLEKEIHRTEQELLEVDNQILSSTNTDISKKIESLQKSLLLLKEKNKQIKEEHESKLKFFFCPL